MLVWNCPQWWFWKDLFQVVPNLWYRPFHWVEDMSPYIVCDWSIYYGDQSCSKQYQHILSNINYFLKTLHHLQWKQLFQIFFLLLRGIISNRVGMQCITIIPWVTWKIKYILHWLIRQITRASLGWLLSIHWKALSCSGRVSRPYPRPRLFVYPNQFISNKKLLCWCYLEVGFKQPYWKLVNMGVTCARLQYYQLGYSKQ